MHSTCPPFLDGLADIQDGRTSSSSSTTAATHSYGKYTSASPCVLLRFHLVALTVILQTDSTLSSMSDTNTSPTPSTSRASSTPPRSDTSAPSSAAPSPPQYPLVKLDTLVYSRDHLRICECTELGVVFKLAWYGDDEVEELEHESAIYEALYRLPAASRFLAPYVGTYEWFGIRLAVVTGSGAEVGEWRQHRWVLSLGILSRLSYG